MLATLGCSCLQIFIQSDRFTRSPQQRQQSDGQAPPKIRPASTMFGKMSTAFADFAVFAAAGLVVISICKAASEFLFRSSAVVAGALLNAPRNVMASIPMRSARKIGPFCVAFSRWRGDICSMQSFKRPTASNSSHHEANGTPCEFLS